ncbi:hypothetical protein FAF44_36195 [Nonomuraea sp. MG754425]|uniref:hypothetical protein n=1 Tax=Nonomuraea sp. MG754425 TaxID=2570319 RepID=UPI001F27BAC4|nr:hypothetical protein [Nonomuraea sp. MG754425]MCF6473786.1 hypothetical protein [Nonomuraea sp. MG754425]
MLRTSRLGEHTIPRAAQDSPIRCLYEEHPAGLIEQLWAQFTTLLPERPMFGHGHLLGLHRRRPGRHQRLLRQCRSSPREATVEVMNAGGRVLLCGAMTGQMLGHGDEATPR